MPKCNMQGCPEEQVNSSKCHTHYNEYMRVYMKARYARRREEWVQRLGGRCEVCGTTEKLEFDHVNSSEKSYDIAKILKSGNEAMVSAEMAKCHLLCKEHHLEKSRVHGDMRQVEHGGGVSGKRGCSCDLCKPAKSAYMKEWKRKKMQREKELRSTHSD